MSPAMYTHTCGYKFYVKVFANQCPYVFVNVYSTLGKFDSLLKYPAKSKFTIELINHHGTKSEVCVSDICTWNKPEQNLDYFV